MQAIVEDAVRNEIRNRHRRLGSTVVPSHDLRRVANSRGEAAKASPSEFGLTREPSNTTVSLTLTPTQLQAARTNGVAAHGGQYRSEEHTSELQSLMRISYAVFCLKHKNTMKTTYKDNTTQH